MFELVSAHKTGRELIPVIFAVKSWEDQILGALVAAPVTVTDHAILKTRLLALFFFDFSKPHVRLPQRELT
jgi:hypothetical protein